MRKLGLTGKRVEVFKDRQGEFRWRAFARNGRQVGKSEEAYRRRNYAFKDAAKKFPGLPIYNEKGQPWSPAVTAPSPSRSSTDWESASLGPRGTDHGFKQDEEEEDADLTNKRGAE